MSIYDESNILKLKYRREQHLLQFMYNKRKDPSLIKNMRRSGVTTSSEKKKNFKIRRPNTEKYKRSCSYRGPKGWNSLPYHVQTSDNITMFKQKNLDIIKSRIKEVQLGEQADLSLG